MTILCLINRWEAGGTRRHIRDLRTCFEAAGDRVLVAGWVTPGSTKNSEAQECIPLPVYDDSGLFNPAGHVTSLLRLVRLCRYERPDVIHVHSRLLLPHAQLLHTLFGIPTVATMHHPFVHAAPGAMWPRHVLCVSDTMRREFLRWESHADPERVVVVRNAIDIPDTTVRVIAQPSVQRAAARDQSTEPAHAPFALPPFRLTVVGRVDEHKGVDVAIDALPMLLSVHEVTLTIVGSGPSVEAMRRRARERGVVNAVSFSGAVEDVARVYQESDVVLLPSRVEAAPYVLLEASAAGRPVICSDLPTVRELGTGIPGVHFLRCGDPADLARVCSGVLNQLQRSAELHAAALIHPALTVLRERHAFDVFRTSLRAVYAAAIRERHGDPR